MSRGRSHRSSTCWASAWHTSSRGSASCRSSQWPQCGWYRTVASSATWNAKKVQPQLDRPLPWDHPGKGVVSDSAAVTLVRYVICRDDRPRPPDLGCVRQISRVSGTYIPRAARVSAHAIGEVSPCARRVVSERSQACAERDPVDGRVDAALP